MANDIKGSLGINPPEDVLKNKEKNENHTSKTLGTRSFEDEEKQDAKTEKAAGQSTEQAVLVYLNKRGIVNAQKKKAGGAWV